MKVKYEEKERAIKTPAVNGRFYEMAAVAPHKRQYDFGGFAPA
jgi:hypothetical protein